MMKFKLVLICVILGLPAYAGEMAKPPIVVKIPYMERASVHREYADALLALALELSVDRYGPYDIQRQQQQTVIRRQLLELEVGDNLTAAISMPSRNWLEKTLIVPLPIMKGMASYRMFFVHKKNLETFNSIENMDALKALKFGQGPGWSTGIILEDNGFDVVYGGPYETLLPMLLADRFQLLMRGIYEIVPELGRYQSTTPDLAIIEGFAVYTYLPMYFFVSKKQPFLAERLEYGLKKAHASGQLSLLFDEFFGETLHLLNTMQRKVFYMPNTNIDSSFYEHDRQYLLDSIITLEAEYGVAKDKKSAVIN